MSDFGQVPLVMTSVRGARGWRLDPDGVLHGMSVSIPWEGGVNHARHMVRDSGLFFSSYESFSETKCDPATCLSCGFYAYYDSTSRSELWINGYGATGVIDGTGVVHLGTKGFRAQKARIVALAITRVHRPMSKLRWRLDALARRIDINPFTPLQKIAMLALWWISLFVPMLAGPYIHVALAVLSFGPAAIAFAYYLYSDARALTYKYFGAYDQNPFVPSLRDKVAANYPDVQIYSDVAEMLAEHPCTKPDDVVDYQARHPEMAVSDFVAQLNAQTQAFVRTMSNLQMSLQMSSSQRKHLNRWTLTKPPWPRP